MVLRAGFTAGFAGATCVYDYEKRKTWISLASSKTKVAPIRTESTPRLELCAALLLAKLIIKVKTALKVTVNGIFCYSDSTDTLAWISSDPSRWQRFVANRVSKIQNRVPAENWKHVKGTENPADLASRGISAEELVNSKLWWNGPEWISTLMPRLDSNVETYEDTQLEMKKKKCFHTNIEDLKQTVKIWEEVSSFNKAKRIMAWWRRFVTNVRSKDPKKRLKRITGMKMDIAPLTVLEVRETSLGIMKLAQQLEFAVEIECIQSKEGLPRKSEIVSLNPFLDEKGILRVGGRLSHANLPYERKHPIILKGRNPWTEKPDKSRPSLAEFILREEHVLNLHAGPQTLMSAVHYRYWILRGKDAVKRVIHNCVTCTRYKAETLQQKMADLPSFRVSKTYAFQHVGVDYAGPFLIRPMLQRSRITLKAYLSVFVCCATRAIHLEVVSELTTQAFLAAFRRFISRRGKPSDMYSDCGTNFIGASRELKELLNLAKSDEHNEIVTNVLNAEGIQWHFNTPSAPHHGGLWEAGVKSTKHHLIRIMGDTRLTLEELNTIVAQIEAILNSRPLTPESNDPSELRALTPGHFLIGRPLTMFPEPDLMGIPSNRLIRWQLIQQMTQCFWKRWSNEYLTRLQQRPKWMKAKENLREGSLVLIKEDNLPPLKWRLARVTKTMQGKDGLIRRAVVKTSNGEYERPIVKLCLLPIEVNSEEKPNDEKDIEKCEEQQA